MFEKEAEEYIKEHTFFDEEYGVQSLDVVSKTIFKDGAEFGYNKAKVEVEESYRESLCNSELNLASVTEQLEELEKANEWHYVKSEEDLPKDNSEYLLLLEHCIRVFGYYNGKWWESWKGDLSWQEVKAYFFVPVPELPKESE